MHYVTGPRHEWTRTTLSPEHLRTLVPDVKRHDVYLCGPPGMQETVESLRKVGVPRRHIHTEEFAFEGAGTS